MKKNNENEVLTSKENAKGVESQQIINTKGEGSMLNNRQKKMKKFNDEFNVNELNEVLGLFLSFDFLEGIRYVDKDFIDLLVPNKHGEKPEYQNFHEAKNKGLGWRELIYSFSVYNIKENKVSFKCKCYFELKKNELFTPADIIRPMVNDFPKTFKNIEIRHLYVDSSQYDKERFVFRYCFSGEFVG